MDDILSFFSLRLIEKVEISEEISRHPDLQISSSHNFLLTEKLMLGLSRKMRKDTNTGANSYSEAGKWQ